MRISDVGSREELPAVRELSFIDHAFPEPAVTIRAGRGTGTPPPGGGPWFLIRNGPVISLTTRKWNGPWGLCENNFVVRRKGVPLGVSIGIGIGIGIGFAIGIGIAIERFFFTRRTRSSLWPQPKRAG